MTVALYPWQEASAAALVSSLSRHNVAADGSEPGTGKTIKACVVAQRRARSLFVVCPKSVVPDWNYWAGAVGVPATVVTYDKLRTGKTPHGRWTDYRTVHYTVKGVRKTKKVPSSFEFTIPTGADLVFDEAHFLGGIDTQQALFPIAAKRQRIPHLLLSGTLAETPLKMRSIGFCLGLHRLIDFWSWARRKGVIDGAFGPEWPYLTPAKQAAGESIMEGIRQEMGDKFTRIRKADVPDFPTKQIIPFFVETDDMPDDETLDGGRYGYEARMAVELLKVPGIVDRAKDLINGSGHSVAIFVNYLDTLNALLKEFPHAAFIRGGQTASERVTNINNFQTNQTHVILVMTQAGGTGVSLHDLHGRPRSSILCPGSSASQFLQAIDRIHRAAALSAATVYVALASGVPVERRIRDRMEAKINNLSALNDSDFLSPDVTNHNTTKPDDAAGPAQTHPGAALPEGGVLPHQRPHPGGGHAQQSGPGRPGLHPGHDDHGSRGPGPGGDARGRGEDRPLDARMAVPEKGGAHSDDPGSRGGDRPGRRDDLRVGSGEGVGPDGAQDLRDPREGGGAQGRPNGQSSAGGDEVMAIKLDLSHLPKAPPVEERRVVAGQPTLADRIAAPAADATGNHVVRKHARCSPSKLKNLEICPSYEGDNDGPVHPVTLRGTAMHEALETGDDSGLLDEKDNEELRLVTMCRDFQAAEAVPGEIVITEPHLKTHDRDVQGFADRVVLEPTQYSLKEGDPNPVTRHARIRDYKMGWNPVDLPNDNPQAIAYTVAVFMAYPDVTSINFAFLIPRLDAVLEHTFQRSELPALKLRLSVIADRVRKLAGKEFNKDDHNCLYCGIKYKCPAQNATGLAIARAQSGHDLPLPAVLEPSAIVDPQQIAYGLNVAVVLEGWIEQIRKQALALRKELGLEIPGYDLIERSAKREVADPVGAWKLVEAEFGVPQEEYLSACKISITQLEKVVTDRAAHGTKAKVATALTDRLLDEGLLTRGASFSVLQRTKKKTPKTVS